MSALFQLIDAIATDVVLREEWCEEIEGGLILSVVKAKSSFFIERDQFEAVLFAPNHERVVTEFIGTLTGCAEAVGRFREIAKVAAVAPLVSAWYVREIEAPATFFMGAVA